ISGSAPVKYGEVQSPGYPAPYPPSHNEIWDLFVPQGYTLNLTFRHLDIEPSKNCYYDSLMVLYEKRILGVFCGQNHVSKGDHPGNYTVMSPSNSLRLVFKTDASSPGPHRHSGFSAIYQAVAVDCGTPLLPESGVLQLVDKKPKTLYQDKIQLKCESKYYKLEGEDKPPVILYCHFHLYGMCDVLSHIKVVLWSVCIVCFKVLTSNFCYVQQIHKSLTEHVFWAAIKVLQLSCSFSVFEVHVCDIVSYILIKFPVSFPDVYRCGAQGEWSSVKGSSDWPKCVEGTHDQYNNHHHHQHQCSTAALLLHSSWVLGFILDYSLLSVELACFLEFFSFLSVCGEPESKHSDFGRIFGGSEAEPGQIPWQVYVENPRGGGSLISDRWVVTAANVVEGQDSLMMYGGAVDIENIESFKSAVSMESEKIFIHPGYPKTPTRGRRTNYDNDIALVRLKSRVPLGPNLLPICLPERKDDGTLIPERLGFVSGWGRTEHDTLSSKLLYVEIPVKDRATCSKRKDGKPLAQTFSENMFCAGEKDKDSCHGDSGGPFFLREFRRGAGGEIERGPFRLHGVVSWGIVCQERGSAPVKYGEVQSPGYPAPYPPSHNEIWDLLVPQGYALNLTFTNIDIEHSKNCYYDSLMVLHKKRILGVFCGQNHVSKADHPGKYSIKSPGNSLRLVFKTDSSSPGSHKGFSATYQAVDIDECSEEQNKGQACHHLCHNTPGGFVCSCRRGYQLQPDNSTCKRIVFQMLFSPLGPLSFAFVWHISAITLHMFVSVGCLGLLKAAAGLFSWSSKANNKQAAMSPCSSHLPAPLKPSRREPDITLQCTDNSVVLCDTLMFDIAVLAVKCGYPKIPENNHLRVVTENPKTVYQDEIRFGCESKYYRLEGDGMKFFFLPFHLCLTLFLFPTAARLCLFVVQMYLSLLFLLGLRRCEAQGYWGSVNGNRAFPKCVAVCGEPEFEHSNFGRIFGGSAADAGQIPWQIFVETPRGGASLISDRWVLTAANVVEGQDSLLMYGGALDIDHLGDSNNTVFLESEKIFIHPGYPKAPTRGRRTNYDNDIALVRLKSHVPLGPHLLPICLPERKDDGTVIPGRVGYVSGWGTTEHGTISSRLLYTQIPVIDRNPCSKRKTGRPLYQTFSENMFCAGEKGKDSCYGDSGGPFFLREFRRGPGGEIERGPFRLYGIVSWGLYCQERGYYTKVDNYLDWIREIIEKEERNVGHN
ncbi:C1R protein, partial [Atractosteus spatula]|nr:C1R protein [Atractosteus spatula]